MTSGTERDRKIGESGNGGMTETRDEEEDEEG